MAQQYVPYNRTYPVASGPTSTNTVSNATRNLGLSGKQAGSVIFDEGSKNTKPLTERQEQLVNKTYPPKATTKVEDPYVPPTTYGGGSTAQDVPTVSSVSGAGLGATNNYDDTYINKIKDLLSEQEKKMRDYYANQLDQEKASNQAEWEKNRNAINVNDARQMRWLKSMYGDAVSGTGLSNQARLKANTGNKLADNNLNLTNNNTASLGRYNQNISNAAATLAQAYNNYVVPTYESRQRYNDSLVNDLQKYLMALQYNS